MEKIRAIIGILFFVNAIGMLWGMLLGWFPDIPNTLPLIACIILALAGFMAVPPPQVKDKERDEDSPHK